VRSSDLLHVGLALTLKATEFLTFDVRQASLAKAAGLKVKDSVGPVCRIPFGLPRADNAKSRTSAGRATCCCRVCFRGRLTSRKTDKHL
jgi:hypothetical protein